MTLFYDLLSNFWITYINTDLPDYIIKALNWTCFVVIIIVFAFIPILVILIIRIILSWARGGRMTEW